MEEAAEIDELPICERSVVIAASSYKNFKKAMSICCKIF